MTTPTKQQVRGHLLSSRLRYVRNKRGAEALERVLSRLAPQDQQVLRGWIEAQSWYPMDVKHHLEEAIAKELSDMRTQELFLDIGRTAAESNLFAAQRQFVKAGDPQFMLESVAGVYHTFYSAGRQTYQKTGDRSAVIRTLDLEGVSPLDCLAMLGWLTRAIELCGGRDVRGVETACRARGADHCEFRFQWEA
jgi:uncharacterized protein (TIGR02265 family)